MSDIYEENAKLTSKYVHACSNGHEAIQVAAGSLLKKQDWLSCYYRDDSILLSMGLSPYELMLQLFAKKDDPFSGGRTYYSHPSLNRRIFLRFLTVQLQGCRLFRLPGLLWGCNSGSNREWIVGARARRLS